MPDAIEVSSQRIPSDDDAQSPELLAQTSTNSPPASLQAESTQSSSVKSPSTATSFQFDPNAQAKVNPVYALSQKSDRVYHIVSAANGKTKIIEGDPADVCSGSAKDSLHRVWTSLSHIDPNSSDNARKRKASIVAASALPDHVTDGGSTLDDADSSKHSSVTRTPVSGFFERFHNRHNKHGLNASGNQTSPPNQIPVLPALRPPSLPPTPPLSERQSEDEHYNTADEADEANDATITHSSAHSDIPSTSVTDEPPEMKELYINRKDIVTAAVLGTAPGSANPSNKDSNNQEQTIVLQTSPAQAAVQPSQSMTYLAIPTQQLSTIARESEVPAARSASPVSQVSFCPSVNSSKESTPSSPTRLDMRRSHTTQSLTLPAQKGLPAPPPNAVASSSRTQLPSPTVGPTSLSVPQTPSGKARAKSPVRQNSFGVYTPEPAGDITLEDTIAKEADEIRRERLSRRLEKEREREQHQQQQAQAVSQSQPYRRERSTSKGNRDGDEHGRGWAQPIPQPGLLQRAGTMIEDKPMIGNLIGEDHVNYVLMYNMLTGIRIGVSRCQAKPKRPLVAEDYTAQHKFSFDIIGNELTPSARYDFKFKDYAPWVFRDLREHFMLDPADYLLSLTAKYILSEMGSPGKSGSFFYFSRDYRFIIKTIHHAEHKFLRRVLKPYHEHVKSNPHTLISRFYGLHRVKLPRGRKIHFVIMNNLMPPHRDVHETYDLKGSTVKREYPEEKAAQNPHATLKDLNWLHRGRMMHLGPEKRALLSEQLKQDTAFLQTLGVMDYSLLIGFHDVVRGNTEKLREGALSMFNPETSPKLKRRQTQREREREQDPSAVRLAVERSDPKAIADVNWLPDKDRSERRYFIFYQDEGGLQATDNFDQPLPTIYYMGIIDILTPWNCKKIFENFFKGLAHDRHAISPVPPNEYGNRFLRFITSIAKSKEEQEKALGLSEKQSKRLSQPSQPMSEKVKVQ